MSPCNLIVIGRWVTRICFCKTCNDDMLNFTYTGFMKILVTGGAGFIGSNLIRHILRASDHHVINLDNLTYAGGLSGLRDIETHPRYGFEKADIRIPTDVEAVLQKHQPAAIMHLAAETHVDRSIDGPRAFMETNILGTYTLVQAALRYSKDKPDFRFHHISTDEVFGDLAPEQEAFTETTSYKPNSPYSASKAASDHLVRAWHRTYGLPVIITNCTNNYGPYQFPEKLIPHMILNALHGKPLPVYGDGQQIRDWLHVTDHAEALLTVLERGKIGETYNIGGNNQVKNLQVVEIICDILQNLRPADRPYKDLIEFVTDRPGHDRRYAMRIDKIQRDLGWSPKHDFETGLRETVEWYLENEPWWRALLDGGQYELKRIGEGQKT